MDCNKDKTNQEKLDGSYKSKDIESTVFNTHVIDSIINFIIFFKSEVRDFAVSTFHKI